MGRKKKGATMTVVPATEVTVEPIVPTIETQTEIKDAEQTDPVVEPIITAPEMVVVEEPVKEEAITKEVEGDVPVIAGLPIAEVSKPTTFEVVVLQRDDAGAIAVSKTLKFELPDEVANKVDYIVGTALDELFCEMDLHKAVKSRLFDSRKPLELVIKSDHMTLELGKVEKTVLSKLKLNSGERSKLLFIDKFVAITNHILRPLSVMRATELRENMKVAAHLKYGKESKGAIGMSALLTFAKSELSPVVVMKTGELAIQNN